MVNILWIASDLPMKEVKHAGSQTFNFYFNAFRQDKRFDVRLVALSHYNVNAKIEEAFCDIKHDIIYYRQCPKFKKIMNIESRYNLFNRHAGLLSNYCSQQILKTVKKYKAENYNPDIIIMEWTQTVVLAKELRRIFPQSKMVASEHDVTFIGYERKKNYHAGLQRMVWDIKYRHERRVELSSLKLSDLILPHNADNKEVLVSQGISKDKIFWLVPYFNNMKNNERNSNHKDILFFGAMSRAENYLSAIWFIENVMPRIQDLDVRFVVLGSHPPYILKNMENERVHITGFVDSIEPYFEQSMCLVAPLVLGAGIKVKILEAMSAGIPILTNEIGIEGIPAKDKTEYIHCEGPEEYEEAIRQIYCGDIEEETITKNAKQFMQSHFSLEDCLSSYKDKIHKMGEKK